MQPTDDDFFYLLSQRDLKTFVQPKLSTMLSAAVQSVYKVQASAEFLRWYFL